MKKAILFIALLLLVIVSIGAIRQANRSNLEVHLKKVELQNNEVKLKKLESDFKTVNEQKAGNEQQVKELELKRQQLEEEKKALEAQLQAKAELKKSQVATVYAAAASPTSGNCGDNFYKQYIYQHESGCRTDALNSIGCYGIGQSCPKSKIAHCGADFACQDAWFSNYAIQRYGSWEAAYNFWVANRWW